MNKNWHNSSGRPLSDVSWLMEHHSAKRMEREAFCLKIAQKTPNRIVDLGCGPGLWLELLNKKIASSCEFFGVDGDEASIRACRNLALSWERSNNFYCSNIEKDFQNIPDADIFLAFNIMSYVKDIDGFLFELRKKIRPGGFLIVRQYDGALLRIGPMDISARMTIDASLAAAVQSSQEFNHYPIDRIYSGISSSGLKVEEIGFEVFHRTTPFCAEFLPYLNNTIAWTAELISEKAKRHLLEWHLKATANTPQSISYFSEFDLVAWLS